MSPQCGPREIVTPFRPIPLEVPEGMAPNEFFNSAENLNDLVHNNGLLQNPEGLLLYRKALGHSNLFDTSIIYNTSQQILDPLGRPVRRTQVPDAVKHVWNRMNQILIAFMLERYPDPERYLLLAGEASLDATWPLTSPGVPSIRMLHNHFMVFDKHDLAAAPLADPNNPHPHALRQGRMPPLAHRLSAGPAELGRARRRGGAQGSGVLARLRHAAQGLPRLLPHLLRPGEHAQFAAAARFAFPDPRRGEAAVRQRLPQGGEDGARPLHQGCEICECDPLAAGLQATHLSQ
jgi:hypothetical protein